MSFMFLSTIQILNLI